MIAIFTFVLFFKIANACTVQMVKFIFSLLKKCCLLRLKAFFSLVVSMTYKIFFMFVRQFFSDCEICNFLHYTIVCINGNCLIVAKSVCIFYNYSFDID